MARGNLFTAADVAVFCAVDLKTIHNWVERGYIKHFRTPGRHLRFQPEDVAAFLKLHGYQVPKELAGVQPAEDVPTVTLPRRAPRGATAKPKAAPGPRARVTDVFHDGSIMLTVPQADLAAFRAMEGRDVVLALVPAEGAAA
ncbi:helix-turn-helix domain-containing protein [Sorangium sp. So ce233]|uniref:helix-turn-helix domain-containing protein n=1 Tax=Sorangium sp. So ce233 TaxID=3133290 RepID=UPI003F6256B0